MPSENLSAPRQYKGVMVSSTFTDLEKHRKALIKAIAGQKLMPVVMEYDTAKPDGDVLESSLQMVQDGSAYIGVISHKYGQIPECDKRNPNRLSLTELEFNEAQYLGRPVLLFIMGNDHYVRQADVEKDPEKLKKLETFRESAKRLKPNSSIHRIYYVFNDINEFAVAATQSIADLRRHLDGQAKSDNAELQDNTFASESQKTNVNLIPRPPALYAEPAYIGSHSFVGREAQIETLSDWATPSDSHPVLLFEAIGGTGKSMLTWEWTNNYSTKVRNDWAGRFWYSFYEKGATMLDFCRRALVYMTGQPASKYREMNTAELTAPLVHQLQARPWLLILDGLERVLVAYHRFDAAQVLDEEAGTADKIAHRDPCAAINPEDDDLLRALSSAHPSKLLLTSRLIPRALLNRSSQPIPGVLRERLPGLRPADAELLIRVCGVTGTSVDIQNYLKSHCDCHPLVIGVLAGLINDYLPNKGNFDAWAADTAGGGQLNLANLDLVQKRNHILNAALAALPEKSRQLLSTLALLSESVDYPTLSALNPHIAPEPEEVPEPPNPDVGISWKQIPAAERLIPTASPSRVPSLTAAIEKAKAKVREDYQAALHRRKEYEQSLKTYRYELRAAAQELAKTVSDLERRGLLQYDAVTKRHDLHPVVRGISAGGLKPEEKTHYGQRVVDHFSQQAQDPYEEAETLEDFSNARRIVKALFQMGKLEQARDFILKDNFIQVLGSKFEAHNEILTIIRPFFSLGWSEMPGCLEERGGTTLAKKAGVALRRIGELQDAFIVSETSLRMILRRKHDEALCSQLFNLSSTVGEQNRLALEDRLMVMATDASIQEHKYNLFSLRLARFRQLSKLGKRSEAESFWPYLSAPELTLHERCVAAHHYVLHLFFFDNLNEKELANAERLSRSAESALGTRNLCALRGFWRLDHGDWESAKKSLQDAVALAHKAGKVDRRSEIRLALAKYNLNQLLEPREVAEQFLNDVQPHCHRDLANLWLAIGNHEQARQQAVAAYKWASADGEPYVHRYELEQSKNLLKQLGAEIPFIPPYNPFNHEKLSWENEVDAAIKRLREKTLVKQA